MTRPDILVGWNLLSEAQQTDIRQMLPASHHLSLPPFALHFSKNDATKLVSSMKRCEKKNHITKGEDSEMIHVKSGVPLRFIPKFHSFIVIKQSQDGNYIHTLDLVKIESLVKRDETKRCNSKDASEAWRAAVKMFIVCKIKKEILKDLRENNCDRFSAKHHIDIPTVMEKWWQQFCIWKERENAERAQLKQYIEYARFARVFTKQVGNQEGGERLESEITFVILTRLELLHKSQAMQARFEKKMNRLTHALL